MGCLSVTRDDSVRAASLVRAAVADVLHLRHDSLWRDQRHEWYGQRGSAISRSDDGSCAGCVAGCRGLDWLFAADELPAGYQSLLLGDRTRRRDRVSRNRLAVGDVVHDWLH